MTVVEPGSNHANLIARVKNILLLPSQTWDEIDVEPASVGAIYTGYVIPLAGIAAISALIGLLLFSAGMWGLIYHPSIINTLVQAAVSFVLMLGSVYLLAVVVDLLAPKFGGTSNRLQAFKLAAYSGTAGWVGGFFALIPTLGGLLSVIGAIYSLVIFYKGLPRLMKNPQEKTLPYFAVIVVVVLVIMVVLGSIETAFYGWGRPITLGRHTEVTTVTVPGAAAAIDLGKLQQAEDAAKAIQAGKAAPATDPDALKAFLPASIAGYARSSVETGSGEMAGINGSNAKASYTKGDAHIDLSVTDIGAAGALAGLAGSFKVKSSKQEGDRYEKVDNANGRMTDEEYDGSTKAGKYSVMVGDKFMVEADGQGASMDELKAAVGAVDTPALEAAAKKG